MSADSSKNEAIDRAETCALYYFPEISASTEKASGKAGDNRGQFVGNAPAAGRPRQQSEAETQRAALDAQLEAAFNQGLAQGREAGLREAAAEQRAAMACAADALNSAVDAMARARRQDVAQMEHEALRLAMAIARKIVGVACQSGTAIEHVLKQALQQVPDPRQLVVRLNPQDVETVKSVEATLPTADDADARLRIHTDDTIQRGGCIVETKLGDVDARIEQQIRIIEDQLAAQLPPHAAES